MSSCAPMQDHFRQSTKHDNEFLNVFRGGTRIGRIIFDGKEPGGLWEPTPEFEPLRHLFEIDNRYSALAGEDPNNEVALFEIADRALNEILEPGVEARQPDGRFAFEIISISVEDGRVTWRSLELN